MKNGKKFKAAIPVFAFIAVFCMVSKLSQSEFSKGLWIGIAASILANYFVSLFESLYGVSNTKRIEEAVSRAIEEIFPIAKDLHDQGLMRSFSQRQEVNWAQLEQNVHRRYWVCGITMRPLAEQPRILNSILSKEVNDIRIILPNTEDPNNSSYSQLDEYNRRSTATDDHIKIAEGSFTMISKILQKYGKGKCIKRYKDIMYECIAVHDDIAIIASYNSTGVGDDTWALQFRRNSPGYRYVENEFQRLWDAST